MADLYYKRGDRLPILSATLKDGAGTAINLTAATVTFKMTLKNRNDGSVKVNAAAAVVSAVAGTVTYTWGASDLDTPGEYLGEFFVDYGSGSVLSVPNSGYITILVADRLA